MRARGPQLATVRPPLPFSVFCESPSLRQKQKYWLPTQPAPLPWSLAGLARIDDRSVIPLLNADGSGCVCRDATGHSIIKLHAAIKLVIQGCLPGMVAGAVSVHFATFMICTCCKPVKFKAATSRLPDLAGVQSVSRTIVNISAGFSVW